MRDDSEPQIMSDELNDLMMVKEQHGCDRQTSDEQNCA